MDTLVLVSLGSNIEPERNLPEAARQLARFGRNVRTSAVWQSKPVGDPCQADFLNAAVALHSPFPIHEWLHTIIPTVEQSLGRKRHPANKNAPRTIDLDLAMFGDFVGHVGHRQIPDPDILTRWFVALPLAEVAPDVRHPLDGRPLREIARELLIHISETPLIRTDVRLVP